MQLKGRKMTNRTSRRDFMRVMGAGAVVLGTSPLLAIPQKKKPNLLYIFPDEWRRQALGFMGEDPVVTPNLDKLCEKSVVFTNAVSNRPVCSPYRAMFFTGRYPYSNGVLTNVWLANEKWDNELRPSSVCFPDVMKANGWHMGYIGKWHLTMPKQPYVNKARGGWNAWTPPHERHGFEFWHSYGCFDEHMSPHYWTTNAGKKEEIEVDDWSPHHEASVAIDFIKNKDGKVRDPNKPWGLVMSMNPPHMPFSAFPKKYLDFYEGKESADLLNRPNVPEMEAGKKPQWIQHAKNYFSMVTGVDEQIGRVLKTLEESGEADNTIVIVTSDHGEMMGSHGKMHKSIWYEESIGVPFILHYPGKLKPRKDDLILSVPDIYPTLLGLVGLGDKVPARVEGINWSQTLMGLSKKRPSSALYLNTSFDKAGYRGLYTHRHTLVWEPGAQGGPGTFQLWDRKEDPYQMKEIAAAEPETVKKLALEMKEWLIKTKDPVVKQLKV